MIGKPNKPKGSRVSKYLPRGIKPGDYYHLKSTEMGMEPTVNYDTKELGQRYTQDGQEIMTERDMRIERDERQAIFDARTRMQNIKRKRTEPTINISPIKLPKTTKAVPKARPSKRK